MTSLVASPKQQLPGEPEASVLVDFDDHELPTPVKVVQRSSFSNVSALSNSGVESSLPIVSEDEADITTAKNKKPISMETEALLAETERLIAHMNHMSKSVSSFTGVGVDPEALNATSSGSGSPDPEGDSNNNGNRVEVNVERNENGHHALDAEDFHLMMAKAEQLSRNMASISENISLSGSAIRKEHELQISRMSVSSVRSSSSRRDPDGSSLSDLQNRNLHQSAAEPADLTPTSTDDASSQGGKKSLRQDPPGSTTGFPGNQNEAVDNIKMDLLSPIPTSSSHQRPTSSVHVSAGMMDDDVSSVGSASFRPYPRARDTPRNQFHRTTSYESPQLVKDDLLGVLPSRAHHKMAGSPIDATIPEAYQEPVCTKIPPTDLRADYDVTDSSSPRNASEGTVQWEKVETAAPGEEDYVPLVDYSHMRPSSFGGSPGGGRMSQGSRLERHRMRVEARRKRRMKMFSVVLPVILVMLAGAYYQFFHRGVEEVVIVEEEEEEIIVPLWKTYDTTLLQDPSADGFCFEASTIMDDDESPFDDNHSLLVTFPKFIPPPEEPEVEEKPRRGFFGFRRQK